MKNILVVDDDKINLVMAKKALGELYKVIAVPSGKQALKYLESNTCDLVLLDINMPEMNGFEVMDQIKGMGAVSKIPIIFLTADSDPETENKCLEAGAVDYIVKPFVIKVLRSRISRTLELEDFRNNMGQMVEEKTEHIICSYEKVFNMIEKFLKTQSDPELGRLFMECRKELEEI